MTTSPLSENLAQVRRRLTTAAQRAGRSDLPRLIAVSKTFPATDVRTAAAAGQIDFGENRVQEAQDKMAATADLGLSWHLIGHLQTNKAKKAAGFTWIHSIDSITLLQKVEAGAREAGTRPKILLQVDLAGEATKFGAPPDALRDLAQAAVACVHVELRGLMIIPPAVEDAELARPWFRRLRHLREQLLADGIPAASMTELSMGMSHDFEIAVEEGATMVRVGSAIFGQRPSATQDGHA